MENRMNNLDQQVLAHHLVIFFQALVVVVGGAPAVTPTAAQSVWYAGIYRGGF